MKIKVCYNCGYRTWGKEMVCPVCSTSLDKVNIIEKRKLSSMNADQIAQWVEKKIGHPISQELKALREEYFRNASLELERKEREELDAMVAALVSGGGNKVTCFYCHSTNVSKIGVMNRVGSAEVWGLGSDKIGKQFHCNNCGANF